MEEVKCKDCKYCVSLVKKNAGMDASSYCKKKDFYMWREKDRNDYSCEEGEVSNDRQN